MSSVRRFHIAAIQLANKNTVKALQALQARPGAPNIQQRAVQKQVHVLRVKAAAEENALIAVSPAKGKGKATGTAPSNVPKAKDCSALVMISPSSASTATSIVTPMNSNARPMVPTIAHKIKDMQTKKTSGVDECGTSGGDQDKKTNIDGKKNASAPKQIAPPNKPMLRAAKPSLPIAKQSIPIAKPSVPIATQVDGNSGKGASKLYKLMMPTLKQNQPKPKILPMNWQPTALTPIYSNPQLVPKPMTNSMNELTIARPIMATKSLQQRISTINSVMAKMAKVSSAATVFGQKIIESKKPEMKAKYEIKMMNPKVNHGPNDPLQVFLKSLEPKKVVAKVRTGSAVQPNQSVNFRDALLGGINKQEGSKPMAEKKKEYPLPLRVPVPEAATAKKNVKLAKDTNGGKQDKAMANIKQANDGKDQKQDIKPKNIQQQLKEKSHRSGNTLSSGLNGAYRT